PWYGHRKELHASALPARSGLRDRASGAGKRRAQPVPAALESARCAPAAGPGRIADGQAACVSGQSSSSISLARPLRNGVGSGRSSWLSCNIGAPRRCRPIEGVRLMKSTVKNAPRIAVVLGRVSTEDTDRVIETIEALDPEVSGEQCEIVIADRLLDHLTDRIRCDYPHVRLIECPAHMAL